ncbi:MAG: VTT domain-containing protein [Thermovenabulum sp.]|uniref:VTT domain-containing protein n=1 Tax=Thermovenabulum sp. TaxID=3100335 RepID=UPI003C7CA4E7
MLDIQNSVLGLFVLSFAEASFFPVPPDLILIPLCFAHIENSFFYALIASLASALGGLFGYFLGTRAGRKLLLRFISSSKIEIIEENFKKYGAWAVAVAGFTPIPYKVFTIASGIFRMDIFTFFIAALLSRSARFFLEAFIVISFGEKAEYFVNKVLGPGSFIAIMLVFGIYYVCTRIGLFAKTKKRLKPVYEKINKLFSGFINSYGEFGVYIIAGLSFSAVASLIFIKMVTELREKELDYLDGIIVKFILTHLKSPLMDKATQFFIEIVESPYIIIFILALSLVIVFIFYKKLSYLIMTAASFLGALVIQLLLKNEIQRLRPIPDVPMNLFFKYGFPSGSILVITSFIGYTIFLIIKKLDKKIKKYAIIFIAFILIVLIGFSRVYNLLNYPSDVFAGLLIGGIWLSALIIISFALENYAKNRRV